MINRYKYIKEIYKNILVLMVLLLTYHSHICWGEVSCSMGYSKAMVYVQ